MQSISAGVVFVDKPLACQSCGLDFVFSASEQGFFASRDLRNEPKKCHDCRHVRKLVQKGLPAENMTEVNCATCGITTRVPFKPTGYKPVYCGSCMHGLWQLDCSV